jgi:hypothetical protein
MKQYFFLFFEKNLTIQRVFKLIEKAGLCKFEKKRAAPDCSGRLISPDPFPSLRRPDRPKPVDRCRAFYSGARRNEFETDPEMLRGASLFVFF